jgi:hypothetical protein
MKLAVDGWFEETHDGVPCRFACVQYEHFGFALERGEVAALTEKLTSLLESGICQADQESTVHVDWSQADSDWVMVAFRPAENCRGRFYDFPKAAVVELRDRLEELLKAG